MRPDFCWDLVHEGMFLFGFEVLAKILIFLQFDQNSLEFLLKDNNSYFQNMSHIFLGFAIMPINYDENDAA